MVEKTVEKNMNIMRKGIEDTKKTQLELQEMTNTSTELKNIPHSNVIKFIWLKISKIKDTIIKLSKMEKKGKKKT